MCQGLSIVGLLSGLMLDLLETLLQALPLGGQPFHLVLVASQVHGFGHISIGDSILLGFELLKGQVQPLALEIQIGRRPA